MQVPPTLLPDERELALARAHPRATEKRRLTPYRAALASPQAYASLPRVERDEIVRWAESRRRLRREDGIDADPANLVDPLVPEARLRALVIEGEIVAGAAAASAPELAANAWEHGLPAIVAALRARADSD
jgi:hypothetical protein